MSIIIELVIGVGVGTLVAYLLHSDAYGPAALAGMVGAVLFGVAYSLFSTTPSTGGFISLGGFLVAVLGALAGTLIWHGVRHLTRPRR